MARQSAVPGETNVNGVRTFLLMGALTSLLVVLGGLLGGQNGAFGAFLVALVMNLGSYWFSDRIVLAMYGARVVTEAEAPALVQTVARLARRADLPMPRVALIPMEQPNAFATGRNPETAVVAITEGLLRMLNQDELEGVMAHELAHVKNRDILVSTLAATMVGAITMISRWGLFFGGDRDRGVHPVVLIAMAIVAPLAALLVQLAISRGREFGADEGGARISGKPWALASALHKLESYAHARPADVNPSTAHMFIISPLGGVGAIANLFRTHPATQDRVARLMAMKA